MMQSMMKTWMLKLNENCVSQWVDSVDVVKDYPIWNGVHSTELLMPNSNDLLLLEDEEQDFVLNKIWEYSFEMMMMNACEMILY